MNMWTAEDVSGRYVLEGLREGVSELLLHPDRTFEYSLTFNGADYPSKGTWRCDGEAVILNTEGKAEPPFRFVRSAKKKVKGIRVWVKTVKGAPARQVDVAIRAADGFHQAQTDKIGKAIFPDAASAFAAALQAGVYPVKGGPFDLNPVHNDFEFLINEGSIAHADFRNERLHIHGEALEFRYWERHQPLHYQKVDRASARPGL